MDRAIFKKEFKDIDQHIKKLRTLEGKPYIDQTLLLKDINALRKGDEGESKVSFQLRNICKPIYCFHNIKLKYGEDCLQCDFIVITKDTIYVMENKNWKGDITFLQNGTAIRKINKCDEPMGNPYSQSKRQADNLKYILVNEGLIPDNIEVRPMVVIANKYSVIKYDETYPEIRSSIIYAEDLNVFMDKEFELVREPILTAEDIKSISKFLIKNTIEEPPMVFDENKYRISLSKNKEKLDIPEQDTQNSKTKNNKYNNNKRNQRRR
jgi:Predicted phosphohydrolases